MINQGKQTVRIDWVPEEDAPHKDQIHSMTFERDEWQRMSQLERLDIVTKRALEKITITWWEVE